MKHCRHFFCGHLGKLGYFPLSLQYYVFNTVRGVLSLLLCVFNTVNSPFQTYWSIWTVEYHKVQVACSTSHIMGINPSEGVMIVTRCVILGATKLLCASSKLLNFQNLAKVFDKCWGLFVIVIRKLCTYTQAWLSFDWNFTTCSKGIVKRLFKGHIHQRVTPYL